MSVGVGAIHLGWDVLATAAGGGSIPVEPVLVDGEIAPPAYLRADSTGRIHTGRADRDRPDVGVAVRDVRDLVERRDISIAGASWPVNAVFQARLHNPLNAVREHLGREPHAVAVPYPDDWSDERVDFLYDRVAQMGANIEVVPESVALAGYVRGSGLVHEQVPGATVVYSDSRFLLVVAAQSDADKPTESIDVPLKAEAFEDAAFADDLVWSTLAAAKSIGSDARLVLLAGNIVYNDYIRMAFLNHLGNRLQIAQHPLHAVALGAAYLISEDDESEDEAGEPVELSATSDRAEMRGGIEQFTYETRTDPAAYSSAVEPTMRSAPTSSTPSQADQSSIPARAATGKRWRRGLVFAFPGLLLLASALWLGRWLAGQHAPSENMIAAALAAVPRDDAFPGLAIDDDAGQETVDPGEMSSMACGRNPLTQAETDGVRASATRAYSAPLPSANEPSDSIEARAMTFAPGAAEAALDDIRGRVQECPTKNTDGVRYVVPELTSGSDADRVAWRGQMPISAATLSHGEKVTCLLERVDDRLLRSCGTSLDSRRADALARSGLDAMRQRLTAG